MRIAGALLIVATYALGALTAGAPSQGSVRWLAVLMMASGAGLLLADAISHNRSTGARLRLIGAAILAVAVFMSLANALAPGAPAARATPYISGFLFLGAVVVLVLDWARGRRNKQVTPGE